MRLPLIGAYQAVNALLAAGLAIAAGRDADRVFARARGPAGASRAASRSPASVRGAPDRHRLCAQARRAGRRA